MKKFTSSLLLAVMLFSAVVIPANAFFAALARAALALAVTSEGRKDIVALGVSTALHVGVALMTFEFNNPASPTNSTIKVSLNPHTPLDVPGGWSPGAAGVQQPKPPNTGGAAVPTFNYGTTSSTTSFQSACNASQSGAGNVSGTGNYYPTVGTWNGTANVCGYCYNGSMAGPCNSISYPTTGFSCPAGYVNTSGTCTLSSAWLVIKPADAAKAAEFLRSGNDIIPDPQAAPANTIDPTSTVFAHPAAGQIVAKDPTTNAMTAIVIDQTSGAGTMTVDTPNTTTNTTARSTVTFSAPDPTTGQVTVTGTKDETFAGTGSLIGTTPISTTTPSGSGATSGDMSAVVAAVNQVHQDLSAGTMPSATGNFDSSTTALNAITPQSKGFGTYTGQHGLDWLFPSINGSDTCTNLVTWHVLGVIPVTLDYCTYLMPFKAVAGYFLYLVTLVYCYRRMMWAVGGAT